MPRQGPTNTHHGHRRATGCPQHGHGTEFDYNTLDLYVQICYPEHGAVHWLIYMGCPGADRGTRFHSTGCYGQRKFSVEHNMRFESRSVEQTHYLGRIHESEGRIVSSEAAKIPLQSCQTWACYLILRLERKGLLEAGTYNHYMHCYPHRREEDFGPGRDIECPTHHRH
ncbi:hypothetical protein N7475_004289 [Penicillium sp. IBT 31633x]|nr:hypothetical protein N7475_004289 [Penicillium sp. IBT 31633x]